MVSEGKHRENREINWKGKKNEHWASQVALVVRGFLEKGVMATNCWYAFFPGGYWGRLNTLSSL